ncbi:MAG: S-layer homology domain-containing protein [Anaerotignum sp.]
MKRFMTILLAGILCITMAVPAFAAIQTNAGQWAKPSMEFAYNEGLVTEGELQKAKSPMSRKEFCKMVMRFLNVVTEKEWEVTQESPFDDCDDKDVIAAYEAGIIGGIEPGIFAPDRTLTREQMAIMIGRVLKTCGIDLTEKAVKNPFTDTAVLYDSSNKYIDQLYGIGIVAGYADGTYGPFKEMTVQEAVVSFVKAYRYTLEQAGVEGTPAAPENPETKPEEPKQEAVPTAATETVIVGDKKISLGWTAEELKATWGDPDRMDTSVYGLDRYIYINEYADYFFATFQNGKVVEIFVPGTDFSYMGMSGKGTTADIENLAFISSAEHSAVIQNTASEARVPLDYEGKIAGLLLQTKEFAQEKNPLSTLLYETKEDIEAQLLDLIQVRRMEKGLPLLTWDKKLWNAARAHSEDMTSKNYFDYNSPDGTTPFGRIMERGKEFLTASEVIARQRGDVVNIYQEWMRSAAKHNGLMDQTMQEVGIGVSSKTKILFVTVDLCGQGTQTKK